MQRRNWIGYRAIIALIVSVRLFICYASPALWLSGCLLVLGILSLCIPIRVRTEEGEDVTPTKLVRSQKEKEREKAEEGEQNDLMYSVL